MRLLVTSGLRISEAIALRWSDLDLLRGAITVRRKYYRGDLGEPKTPAAKRTRWIGGLAQELLQLRNQDQDGFIFGEGDHPINEKNLIRRRLRPVLRRLGLYSREWAGTVSGGGTLPHYRPSEAHQASKPRS